MRSQRWQVPTAAKVQYLPRFHHSIFWSFSTSWQSVISGIKTVLRMEQEPPSVPSGRLPPRPSTTTAPVAPIRAIKKHYLKQRERDFPAVQWDQALAHFAACVRLDLQELNTEFVARVRPSSSFVD